MSHSRKTAGRTLGEHLWLHKNDVATIANRKSMCKLLLDQILQTKRSKDYQFYDKKYPPFSLDTDKDAMIDVFNKHLDKLRNDIFDHVESRSWGRALTYITDTRDGNDFRSL